MKKIPILLLLSFLISCSGDISSQVLPDSSSLITFTVLFDSRGGSVASPQTVQPDSFISPPNVSKEGHTLEGWYTSLNGGVTLENKWNFLTDSVNIDFTLYASWTINQYTITFITNGGDVIQNQTNNYNETVDIPNATREGYSFEGWFTDNNLTQSYIASATMPAQSITLYAKWNLIAQFVSLSSSHSSALSPTGQVFMWGSNGNGQLGDGTTTDRIVPTEITSAFSLEAGDQIISLSLGVNSSSALSATGRVFMWGFNDNGKLGDGTTTDRNIPTEITSRFSLAEGDPIISLSLGWYHSSALSATGRVFMWGYNGSFGLLGDGTTTSRNVPTEITSKFSLSEGDQIISLTIGWYHSSALTSTRRVFMWGSNGNGQLGDGTTTDRIVPTEITSYFLPFLWIISLSLGKNHSSALSATGRVFVWGNNYFGELGDGTTTDRYVPTEITSRFLLEESDQIISLSLGIYYSSALSATGRVFMWGNNEYGQLGDGTTTIKFVPTEITSAFSLAEGGQIILLSLGAFHSSALSTTGQVFMWGNNEYGRLGDGTTTNRNVPIMI
jgi:uncharacterized repeat protein (TIGR02543 family)